MVKIILERHGQSEANLIGVFGGHTDFDLTPTGYEQAKKSGEYILENFKVDIIYSSDLKRAVSTAKFVADKLGKEIITNQNLREVFAGKWDGETFDIIEKNYSEDWKIWRNDVGNSRCTDGESVRELAERFLKALTEIAEKNEGKTVLVTTHATPIRATQCLLKKLPLDEMKNVPWGSNASLTVLEYNNGKWELIEASYDEHLNDLKTKLPANV